jgi:hypothetical protein
LVGALGFVGNFGCTLLVLLAALGPLGLTLAASTAEEPEKAVGIERLAMAKFVDSRLSLLIYVRMPT